MVLNRTQQGNAHLQNLAQDVRSGALGPTLEYAAVAKAGLATLAAGRSTLLKISQFAKVFGVG